MAMRREQEDAWHPGDKMTLRFFIASLLASALLLLTVSVYSVRVVNAATQQRSAHSKKPVQYHYVCPMHDDVTSKKSGTCPKCKMKLVRKPLPDQAKQ
ncbi:MAG TPA: heavy metal-binding domain-containing protein [Pyrinomonadaceae bacterium]|nr:heavy metal-binding domain-containing protein [Pyrinomonadaceae bacterium]